MTFRAVILPVLCSGDSPWPLLQGLVLVARGFLGAAAPSPGLALPVELSWGSDPACGWR